MGAVRVIVAEFFIIIRNQLSVGIKIIEFPVNHVAGSFAGIESFYLALATMSVFMIVSLFLCCISRGTRGDGDRKTTLIFTLIIFDLYVAATYINSVKEILINPILLLLLTFIAAVMLPTAYIFAGRKSNAKGN